jgi:hypothetical protein
VLGGLVRPAEQEQLPASQPLHLHHHGQRLQVGGDQGEAKRPDGHRRALRRLQPANTCNTLAEQLTKQVTISRKWELGEASTSPVMKKPKVLPTPTTRVYSYSLSGSDKMFCCECDQVVILSGLRKHLQRVHQQGIAQYRELYGDPATQIIQLVHMWTVHPTSLAQYSDRHMTKGVGKRPSPMLMTSVTKKSSFTK